ncbi:Pc06g00020 [Penicillium rubens Wisconsin 54-1255]|uniref:Pc06g00020 protein n=1 Tax=Penicillium rubens (strain ATCC 28089 / DSM 1075 / NRRL 1951 / Wisconsin 54-1255) TaxID=500485 RepID=B6GVU8_PENRW|nr:Pc06g00020 [Penicillium rubens Wisconsin 54-1255]
MGGWEIYCAICSGTFSSQVDMDPEGTDEDCYRYDLLQECNLEWLNEVCGLGVNPDARGNENYHDFSEIGNPHVFPFHQICYHDILKRCIHQENPEQIKRDTLFDVLEDLNGGRYVRLQISYGEPEPSAEQVWCTTKGQEILVVNPVRIPQLDSDLDVIMKSLEKKGSPHQNSQSEDIFNILPIELRREVFKHLSVGSILAVKAASLAMHTTTLPRGLWNHRLRSEMPWLWEIHDIDVLQSQESEYKASNLLLDIQTKSQYTSDNDGYILGLANRRRIWGVCEQIRSRYMEKLKGVSAVFVPSNQPSASKILQISECSMTGPLEGPKSMFMLRTSLDLKKYWLNKHVRSSPGKLIFQSLLGYNS